MFNLKNFTEKEISLLEIGFQNLLDTQIITGVNYYGQVFESDVCIPLNYLHHSVEHEEQLKNLIRKRKRLKKLLSNWRKREKQSTYFWDKTWPIKEEERQQGIEFYINGKKVDPHLIDEIESLDEIYVGEGITLARDRGYDINLDITSQSELLQLLNLFRIYCSRFLVNADWDYRIDKNGNPQDNPKMIKEAYNLPVIIYRNRFDLHKNPLRGFKPLKKIALIRGQEELSFCVDEAYNQLIVNPVFANLIMRFRKEYLEEVAYGNALFVNYLNRSIVTGIL